MFDPPPVVLVESI